MKPVTLLFMCTSALALVLPVDVTDRPASGLAKRVFGSHRVAAGVSAAKAKIKDPKTPGAGRAALYDSLANSRQKKVKLYDDPKLVKYYEKFNKHSTGVQKPIPELASQNKEYVAKHAAKPQGHT